MDQMPAGLALGVTEDYLPRYLHPLHDLCIKIALPTPESSGAAEVSLPGWVDA